MTKGETDLIERMARAMYAHEFRTAPGGREMLDDIESVQNHFRDSAKAAARVLIEAMREDLNGYPGEPLFLPDTDTWQGGDILRGWLDAFAKENDL